MNWEMYRHFFETALMPSLDKLSVQKKKKCVLHLDNASYHSCTQNTYEFPAGRNINNALKEQLVDYLTKMKAERKADDPPIEFDPNDKKASLLEKARELWNKNSTKIIEDIAKKHGHEVLFLPPYHPGTVSPHPIFHISYIIVIELNPIERVWGFAKGEAAKRAKGKPTREATEANLKGGLDHANTCSFWATACRETDATITKYKEMSRKAQDEKWELAKAAAKLFTEDDLEDIANAEEVVQLDDDPMEEECDE